MALTDKKILEILKAEREAAQGESDDLADERAAAHDYLYANIKSGHFATDLPTEAGRSKVASTDVHDAIQTVIPDLIEIFTSGDNAVAFAPRSEEDEDQANQETDYVNYVCFEENDGWMALYTNFFDALESKTGIFKWWWEETDEFEDFVFEDKQENEMILLRQEIKSGAIEVDEDPEPDPETGLTTFRARKKTTRAQVRIDTIPPEDFFVDKMARCIADATMAGHKNSNLRAQDLIDMGYDEALVDKLHDADNPPDPEEDARDVQQDHKGDAGVYRPFRRVETVEYHVKLEDEVWLIVTGNDDTVMLHKERISRIQFAVNCPYPVMHRFYGRSLADLCMEIQKIKTSLLRMMMDAFYFGVNPRPEVDMSKAHKATLSDLMVNRPGRPYRVKEKGAVTWTNPPLVGDSVLAPLEYLSTMGEQRTGVVRNAQGLNPDTLHDTAKGAMELMGAAQRRVRMIARIFAETGVKDLFLGVHELIVQHARKKETIRLRNEWVEVDPNKWNRRKDLKIEVGIGSNTKTQEQLFWSSVLQIQREAVQSGLADSKGIYNALRKYLQTGGVRNTELYFVDPKNAPPDQNAPPPDPETIKVQGEMQLKKQKQDADIQRDNAEAKFEMDLKALRTQFEMARADFIMFAELEMAKEQQEAKQRLDAIKVQIDGAIKAQTSFLDNQRIGGDLDA